MLAKWLSDAAASHNVCKHLDGTSRSNDRGRQGKMGCYLVVGNEARTRLERAWDSVWAGKVSGGACVSDSCADGAMRLWEDAPEEVKARRGKEWVEREMPLRAGSRNIVCPVCKAGRRERCHSISERGWGEWEKEYDVHAMRWERWLELSLLEQKMLEAAAND